MKRVLVVGGGGREHALLRRLLRSPQHPDLLAAPGNAGIARDQVPCLDVGAEDIDGLVRVARDERVDLVVVGPEAPLVAGLIDALAREGIPALGPSAAAARLEGSKAYAKQLMREVGVPTASYMVLHSREEAEAQLPCASYPAVLKADRLAAGKGVIIAETEGEAREAVDAFFGEKRFGETEVVLEEYLVGEELSLLALCDGERAVPMAPAQDYKRIYDGDQGPNTGGMGSYSPVPGIDADHARAIALAIHQPVVDELRRRGTPYHGVLYAGLMMTADGPKTLEFNCRFGDPEGVEIEWSPRWAVTIVLASRGYPESSSKGDTITGLSAIDSIDTEVLHAGTAERDSELVTAGGRVLNVTGLGDDPAEARDRAYSAADFIDFPGKQLRRDIAARAVERLAAL